MHDKVRDAIAQHLGEIPPINTLKDIELLKRQAKKTVKALMISGFDVKLSSVHHVAALTLGYQSFQALIGTIANRTGAKKD
jgi:hypothetical protein